MGRIAAWAGLIVGVGAAGCGAGPGGWAVAEGPAAVDTVGGIERWRYPGEGGPALGWAVDTVALIGGALVEDDAYQFNEVTPSGLAADGARSLYVLDRAGVRVLKYDARGRHVATFGRQGGGPGELAMPIVLGVGPGDSIWVADFGNRRYTIYPQDGGDARSQPFGEELGFPGTRMALRTGGLIQDFRPLRLPPGGPGRSTATSAEDTPWPIYRLDPDGTPRDTLWLSRPPETHQVQGGSGGGTFVIRMARAFEPELLWDALSDGSIVVSDSAEYALRLIGPDGAVRRRIDRDLPARATTEADQEAERERVRERLQSGGGIRIATGGGSGAASPRAGLPPGMLEARLGGMTFAPVIPRITGLRVDPADRIWVGVSLETPGKTERIDIFDRDGRLVGELRGQELPDLFLDRSLAARLVRDEMEVQQVLVYRIVEGG